MSANIRFANTQDGENNWPNRKDLVSKIVRDHDIHILATQEGRQPQIRELEILTPQLKLIDGHRNWISERMYPNIFFDPSKFELLDSGDIWLSETPHVPASKSFDSAFPRLCVYSRLALKEVDQEWLVINCHLDHLQEHTRYKQIQVLINQINDVNKDKLPIILMGDFNSGPKGSVRNEVMNSLLNLKDPWIDTGKEEETSFHKFDGKDTTGEKLRIDWILVDKNLESLEPQLIKDNEEGRYPSDHFFIKTKVSIS